MHSLNDIDKISYDILKDSQSLNIFPTPVSRIISYCGLNIDSNIDIQSIHEDYIANGSELNILQKALAKVRGIYDRRYKKIYLDFSQHNFRKNFVTLHEAGHAVLPWQQSIHDVIEDDDDSLDYDIHEEFENEANYFASVTLFQHDTFEDKQKNLSTRIESAFELSKLFGASIHATLIRYVQHSAKRCALLVLENITPYHSPAMCTKRDFFASRSFNEEFGELELPCNFGFKWEFTQHYYYRRKGIKTGKLSLKTISGNAQFLYQFFNNSYNAFVLIFQT